MSNRPSRAERAAEQERQETAEAVESTNASVDALLARTTHEGGPTFNLQNWPSAVAMVGLRGRRVSLREYGPVEAGGDVKHQKLEKPTVVVGYDPRRATSWQELRWNDGSDGKPAGYRLFDIGYQWVGPGGQTERYEAEADAPAAARFARGLGKSARRGFALGNGKERPIR